MKINIPESLQQMPYWGFAKTKKGKKQDGTEKIDKIPCTCDGTICAQASGLVKFTELPPLPNGYFYRFSLGGTTDSKNPNAPVIDPPGVVVLDYDGVTDSPDIERLKQMGYCELSVSGKGVHAFFKRPEWWDDLDADGERIYPYVFQGRKQPEIFSGDKFVLTTGNAISKSLELIDNPDYLKRIVEWEMTIADAMHPEDKVNAKKQPASQMNGNLLQTDLNDVVRDLQSYPPYMGDISKHENDRSRAAQALCDVIARKVATTKDLDAIFKASPFFSMHYPNGDGWHETKERLTYSNAFKEKQNYVNPGGCQQPMHHKESANDDLDALAEAVDELPENTYKKDALKIDLKDYYQHNHLVIRYANYIKERTDAFPEYALASILFTTSVLTQGNAGFQQRYAPGILRCNLWEQILGYSTIARKSTIMKNTRFDLLEVLDSLMPIPSPTRYAYKLSNPASPSGFAQELNEHPVGWFMNDEIAGLLSKMQQQYMSPLRDDWCSIYDGNGLRCRYSKTNKKAGEITEIDIADPFLAMLVATTFDNFSKNTSNIDLTSGWLLRMLYFTPDYIRDEEYAPVLDEAALEREHQDILIILKKIAKKFIPTNEDSSNLIFTLSTAALSLYNKWVKDMQREYGKERNELKLAYLGRLELYAMKIAILNHIMTPAFYEDESIIIPEDAMQSAILLCEYYFMPSFLNIVETVGKVTNNIQDQILGYVKKCGGRCSHTDLQRHMHKKWSVLQPELQALIDNKELKLYSHKGEKGRDGKYYQILS